MSYRRNQRKKNARVARKFFATDGVGLEPGESKRFDAMYVEHMAQKGGS